MRNANATTNVTDNGRAPQQGVGHDNTARAQRTNMPARTDTATVPTGVGDKADHHRTGATAPEARIGTIDHEAHGRDRRTNTTMDRAGRTMTTDDEIAHRHHARTRDGIYESS